MLPGRELTHGPGGQIHKRDVVVRAEAVDDLWARKTMRRPSGDQAGGLSPPTGTPVGTSTGLPPLVSTR